MPTQTTNYWYFPFSPKIYDVFAAFQGQGFIMWHQGNKKYQVGDILYGYASAPVKRIIFKAIVKEIGIIYNPSLDNDKDYAIKQEGVSETGSVCMRVEPLSLTLPETLDLSFLRKSGWNAFMGPSRFRKEQVDAIEAEILRMMQK